MNPADLVESGYAQTPIVVTQSVTLEIDGALRTIDVTTPVWVTRGALAIPRERIPELQLLMQDIVRHAADCERLAAKSDDLRLRWIGLMGDAARWE